MRTLTQSHAGVNECISDYLHQCFMWLRKCLCAGDGLLNDQLTLWRFDVSRQKREWVFASVGWSRLTTWCDAHCVGRYCFMYRGHFLLLGCAIHSGHKASGAVKPEESEKMCLWNHSLFYLTLNWTGLISCKTQDRGDVSEVIKYALEKCKNHPESFFQIARWSACFCSFLLYLHPAKKLTKIVNLKLPLRKRSFSNCHIGRKESRKDNGGGLISLFGLLVWLFSHKAN